MALPVTETIECDILIVGGGMSGCGAAFESKFWGEDLKVVIAEKAVIERSGATGEGLSAINCYMGQRYGWNTPEDFVQYVVNDMMGLAREDLVYDVARHVDSSVHLLEEWGLPIWKKENGEYERIGRWQIPIHGESIKPVTAEPARKAVGPENIYERVAVTHLLTDANDPNRIAGAIGFGVREDKIYVFKAKAVIITSGGASNVFRPRSVNEGIGRTWYSVFATGSAYGLMIPIGTEMTQMEHRFVPTRFKDGYGPVGMWFQYFHARVTNALGEDYTVTRDDELDKYLPYGRAIPTPTPLRNHQMFLDIKDGKGPMFMRTEEAMQKLAEGDPAKMDQVRNEAWEDFLDMTIAQALTWASQNIEPEVTPSEVNLAEPYIMGSHSGEAGAHQMFLDIKEGKGPMFMRTEEAMQKLAEGDPAKMDQVRNEAWEDFLDMTIAQALTWASQNIEPEVTPSEVNLAEPYIMGSHSGEAGAWVSGPEDLSPPEYFWGYNKMTTVRGLFAAGDGVGAAPHKFSSGSFTEGRLAAKAAVNFLQDNPESVTVSDSQVRQLQENIWAPLETFDRHKGASTSETVNPNYITASDALVRLQKIMDEYAGGTSSFYTTNGPTLERGIQLIEMLREDLKQLGARNRHELLRCWEVVHRAWVGEAHMRHLLHRKETRWPGYYYRADYPNLDDENWRVFVNSRYDAASDTWELMTRPYINLVK